MQYTLLLYTPFLPHLLLNQHRSRKNRGERSNRGNAIAHFPSPAPSQLPWGNPSSPPINRRGEASSERSLQTFPACFVCFVDDMWQWLHVLFFIILDENLGSVRKLGCIVSERKLGWLLNWDSVYRLAGIIGYQSKYYWIFCHLLLFHWPFIQWCFATDFSDCPRIYRILFMNTEARRHRD